MLGVVEKSTVRMPRWCCWWQMMPIHAIHSDKGEVGSKIWQCVDYVDWWWFIVVLHIIFVAFIILYYISRFFLYMQRYRRLSCALSWLKAPNCPRAKLKTGQNVFMAAVVAPTHVSHHDATRAAVSTTALGVCAVRVWESKKDPSERPLTNSGRRRRRMMMVNMIILPEIMNMTILLESWWGWGGYTDGLHLFLSTVWHFTCCSFLFPLLCWRIVPLNSKWEAG